MKIIIIGAGPAGVTAVETMRTFDRQTEIIMLTDEPYLPYSPPAMADHFIHGSNLHLWREVDWAEQSGINFRMGVHVSTIEPDSHRIRLDDGEVIYYDQLLIATGARLYAPLAGAELPGIYNFKSLSAAENLVSKVRSGMAKSALVVGAGFIGMEIALLDTETASIALKQMQAHGVDVHLKTKAIEFVGNGNANGVKLESGEVLKADLLIAATGVKPNLDLLNGSGISFERGILVNSKLQTNAPDVFAAGDCVETPDLVTGETFLHAIFPNALEQGRVAGMNMVGYPTEYEGAERMNSLKHLGLPIIAAGEKQGDYILRERNNNSLRTIYIQENRLAGFQLVGDIRAAGVLHSLMIQKSDVRYIQNRLLDPNFGEGMVAMGAMGAITTFS
jgi:nitrite reductase (NADH) large subunit